MPGRQKGAQWPVIGDIRNRRCDFWTGHNVRMRLAELSRLDFGRTRVQAIPPDKVRREDIDDRTQGFAQGGKTWILSFAARAGSDFGVGYASP